MYLILFYLTLLLNILPIYPTNCGCQVDRNSQCSNEEPHKKYSKIQNEEGPNSENFDKSDMVLIEGAIFEMGTNKPVFESDHEGSVRNVTVDSFYLDKYEVSNQKFSEFVQKTGYKTEAEEFGDSFIFEMLVPESEKEKYKDFRAVQAPWWIKMKGVSWKHPEGEGSTINGTCTSLSRNI